MLKFSALPLKDRASPAVDVPPAQPRLARVALAAAMMSALLAATPAGAQTDSITQEKSVLDKPLRLVVTTPAGGPVDTLARILAEAVSRLAQQPVIIDNKPGGTGAIGIGHLKQQAPDGGTLLITANAAFTLVPLIRKMPYRPIDDFSFIGQLVFTPNVFVVPAASPARTLAEFVTLAKSQPGALNYGTMLGIPQHVDFERFKHEARLNITQVPYVGGAPIVTALLSDHVQATLMNVPLVAEWVKSGKLRALATTGSKRIAAMPDVPTFAEAGFPQIKLDAGQAFSVAGPAAMPRPMADKFFKLFSAAANAPETRAKLEAAGFELSLRDGKALQGQLVRELAANEALVKALDFKLTE